MAQQGRVELAGALPAACSLGVCLTPPPFSTLPWLPVEDFLRGIGFYTRILELATQDEGSEEAAAEAAGAAAAE